MTNQVIIDDRHHNEALIDLYAVVNLTSLSKASVYRLMRAGRFPAAIELIKGGRRVAWRRSDVTAWADAPLDWGRPIDF